MDKFKIFAAQAGSKCWCGKDAVITRSGVGIESSYCSTHWATWWENALDISTGTIVLYETA